MPKARALHEKRADYYEPVWQRYELLYEGGHRLEEKKGAFLMQRPAESPATYQERLALFTYRNLVATMVDEIVSATLQAPVTMNREKQGDERPPADPFYAEFFKDPEGKGECGWNDVLLERLTCGLVKCEAWFSVLFEDTPGARNRAEQEEQGGLRARVECVQPERVINAKRDRHGLADVTLFDREKLPGLEAPKDRLIWTVIDRKQIQRFTLIVDRNEDVTQVLDQDVTVEPAKPHRFAGYKERGAVPLVELRFKKGLWLLDKLALIAKEELVKRNGLAWYEHVACFPQPYHKGPETLKETKPEESEGGDLLGSEKKRGAKYVLELDTEGEYGFAEPAGTSLEHLSNRLEQLERDMSKAIHQMAAATGPQAASMVQSAESKVRDSISKRILCERYAKKVRDVAVQVLDLVSYGREDKDHVWEASGADRHDISDGSESLDTAMKVQAVPDLMKSKTLRREIAKGTARALLLTLGVSTETVDAVNAEFDAATYEPPLPPEPPL
jgi:hypothetical protein